MSDADRKEWARLREDDRKRLMSRHSAEMRHLDEQYETAHWSIYDDESNSEWTDEKGRAWERAWRAQREQAGFPSWYISYRANLLRHSVTQYERTMQQQRDQNEAYRAVQRLTDPAYVAVPLLDDVIVELRAALSLIGEPFKWRMVTDFWVSGLKESGWAVMRGGTKVRNPRGGSYTLPDDYSINAPCLEDRPHRAYIAKDGKEGREYKLDIANDGKLVLIVLQNSWIGYDDEKSTDRECAQQINRHILTCPMCDDQIWNDTHRQGHDPQRQWRDEEGNLHGSRSPFAFVLAEFSMQLDIAKARYLVEQFEDADPDDLAKAQALLSRSAKPAKAITSGPPKPTWDEASTVAWLEKHAIPASSSDAEAWRLSKEIEGHPPKSNAIELYQRVRRAAAPPA